MTFVWMDGTIYDPKIGGYRQATAEEVRRNAAEQSDDQAGEAFMAALDESDERKRVRELETEVERLRRTSQALIDAVAPIAPTLPVGQARWDLIRDAWEDARDAVKATAALQQNRQPEEGR